MSHSNTSPSSEPRERYSWISLPESDTLSGITQHEHDEQGDSVDRTRRPESRAQEQREHIDSSPHAAQENETLLSSRASTALSVAVDEHSLDEPQIRNLDDAHERECNTEYPMLLCPTSSDELKAKFHNQSLRTSTDWVPYTLRSPYLITLSLASLILSVVLATLSWQSYKDSGLGDDDGSTGLLVGWRYTPTIIAIFFTQAIVQVAEDVKRTEAYARLADPNLIEAKFTLFYLPKVWWKSIFIGFSRVRSGGHRRWSLALSSLVAGISILSISTFSSSVFVAKDILIQENVQLQRYAAGQAIARELSPIQLTPRRDTYLRTISGYLFNVSTSIWSSDSHVIVPFGKSGGDKSRATLPNGIWQADTEVFHLNYSCTSMALVEKDIINIAYKYTDIPTMSCPNDTCTVSSKGFKIRSEDGCEVQIQGPIAQWDALGAELTSDGFISDTFTKDGGLLWTNMSSNYVSWETLIRDYGQPPAIRSTGEKVLEQWSRTFIYSFSDQCIGRDLLLVSPQWIVRPSPVGIPVGVWEKDSWDNLTIRAQVCTPEYHTASLPVSASIDGAETSMSFDVSEFERHRQPVSKQAIDFDLLDSLNFRSGSWNKYMAVPPVVHGSFEGISLLLASTFAHNLSEMLENVTLKEEASKLRKRFTRELLLSSITETDVPQLEDTNGSVTRVSRRILVVTEVAITLSVLFLLLACYLATAVFYTSIRKRPLNLRSDPATIAGTASLFNISPLRSTTLNSLIGYDRLRTQESIGSRVYHLQDGILSEKTPKLEHVADRNPHETAKINEIPLSSPKSKDGNKNDWRPSMLHKRWLLTLLATVIAIVVTMLVLRKYARENKLSQTAFTYQVNLGFFDTSFSPHSVIATLIAVCIGLSWDGIDKPMRVLQPFLTLSRKPAVSTRGASLTYQSSHWIWAATKAASRRHWVLCLVATGTTLSQILIITMAAVFERQAASITRDTWDPSHKHHLLMTAPFQLRQEPLEFIHSADRTRNFDLDEYMLESSEIVWLYNALDEIVLEAPPLAWTRDEWTFGSLDMERLPNVTVSPGVSSDPGRQSSSDNLESPAKVIFTTSAIRSRLQCSPISVPESGWLEQPADVFPNRTNETLEGFALPTTLFDGESYNTSVFSIPRRLSCCSNGTDPDGQAVVAYWSTNSSMLERVDPNWNEVICTSEKAETGGCTTWDLPSNPIDEDSPADVVVHGAWYRNFTIKWIVGPGVTTNISAANPAAIDNVDQVNNPYGPADEELFYFTEEPKMTIMDCITVIENTTASVTVARSSGNVLNYTILADPEPALNAWEYAWDITYPDPTDYWGRGNVSYGHLFMTQLLTAPHVITPRLSHSWLSYNRSIEETASERFNIRDRDRGLNVDFMSYANWHLANKDTESLLNATTLLRHSEKTLQTFFKHFVNTGTSHLSGTRMGSGDDKAVYEEVLYPDRVNGTFTKRVEVLAMNETATWLSLTILILLIVILVILVVSLQIVYPSSCMQHRVECLADVLAMVAGSEGLIGLIEEQGVDGFAKSGRLTKLGWFRDARGDVRWGVELVDAEGVEWVDGPEKVTSAGHDEESSIQSGEVVDANSALLESERRSPSPRRSVQEQQTEPMLGPSVVANNASRL